MSTLNSPRKAPGIMKSIGFLKLNDMIKRKANQVRPSQRDKHDQRNSARKAHGIMKSIDELYGTQKIKPI